MLYLAKEQGKSFLFKGKISMQYVHLFFYKNNLIQTRGSFLHKI